MEASLDTKEPDPLGRMREIFIWCMRNIALDPQRRRVFDILFLKCEFVEEMGPVRERHQNNMREGIERIERGLFNAIEQGQLPATLDTRLATTLLHALFTGILHDSLMLPEGVDLDRDAERLIDACFDVAALQPGVALNPRRALNALSGSTRRSCRARAARRYRARQAIRRSSARRRSATASPP